MDGESRKDIVCAVLQGLYTSIVEKMNPSAGVLDIMHEKDVITLREMKRIRCSDHGQERHQEDQVCNYTL